MRRASCPLDHPHDVKPSFVFQLEAEPIHGEREDGLVQDLGHQAALVGPVVVAALGRIGLLREFLGDRGEFGAAQHLVAHLDDGPIRSRAIGEFFETER